MGATLRLVLVSDTHCKLDRVALPDGDILIHGGDFCSWGSVGEAVQFAAFFEQLPHRHKIIIAGNHDRCIESDPSLAGQLFKRSRYLLDESAVVEGIKVYGSPWQPWFHNWAFNLKRGPELARAWSKIPGNTDVLVTHGPPHGILDTLADGKRVGCEELAPVVERIKPRLHVFGHIHEAYGVHRTGDTLYINASTCTLRYEPTNPPIVVDLPTNPKQPARLVSS